MSFLSIFRKFAFFNGRSTDGLRDEDLDFQKWINAHRAWRQRLVALLEGNSKEQLDEQAVCRDDRCELGHWIHGNGQRFYGDESAFQRLTNDHAAFHRAAGEVVSLHRQQDERQARRVLNGEFDLCSVRVISGLEALEQRVKS